MSALWGGARATRKKRVSAKSATPLLFVVSFRSRRKTQEGERSCSGSAKTFLLLCITQLACAHMCTYSAPLITTSEAADRNTQQCNIFHAWTCKVIMKVQRVALMKGQLCWKSQHQRCCIKMPLTAHENKESSAVFQFIT